MSKLGSLIANPVPWPNGKKCAVAITFDMDSDSVLHCDFPDTAATKIGTASWLRYDMIAIPRILKLFKYHDIKQTFFIPGWTAEHYPDLVRRIVDDGHEVGLHGYLHEKPDTLSKDIENYWFMRGLDAVEKIVGSRPHGFRAPSYRFSKYTLSNLLREGITYDSSLMGDDVPYLIENNDGSVIELPTDWALDDWPQFVSNSQLGYQMQINSPDRAMDVFLAEFDAAWENGGMWISVWHPFVSGRLARCSRINKMIDYMMEKGGVWFASLEEIASHMNNIFSSGKYTPRRDTIPYHSDQGLANN